MCQDRDIPIAKRTIDNVTDNASRQELDAAVQAFGEAWARGDVAALTKLLSPTYTHTDVKGRHHSCDAWLAYAAGRRGETTQIAFVDVVTRIRGDVAVITGRNDIAGGSIVIGDSRSAISIRFTQVWSVSRGAGSARRFKPRSSTMRAEDPRECRWG
jgi:ketosteroid isomerase-like protein